MSTFELAKQYYPRLWGRERIETLLAAGRLTPEQAAEILPAGSNLDTASNEGEE